MDLICRPGPNPFPSQQERKWGRIAGALLLGLTLLCAACDGSVADGGKQPLRVFAAASLRDVLDEAARAFESAHGGKVVVITGGSNLVADQLFAGAPGDLLISAGAQEVDRLIAAGILDGESRRAVFENQLVVVAPTGSIDRFSEDPMAAQPTGTLGPAGPACDLRP
jgi:molybdate transport system substrate-binding protein